MMRFTSRLTLTLFPLLSISTNLSAGSSSIPWRTEMMSSQNFAVIGFLTLSPWRYLLTASILFFASRSTGRVIGSFQSRSSFSLPSLPFFLVGTAVAGATGCP